jgi:predicted RNA-binding Zn-ribbon protein involved in translation (DUF1610 family)
MQTQPYPTTTTSQPATAAPSPPAPVLRVLHGLWVASCPSCGFQLATARSQERCERRANRRTCPVCHQDGH